MKLRISTVFFLAQLFIVGMIVVGFTASIISSFWLLNPARSFWEHDVTRIICICSFLFSLIFVFIGILFSYLKGKFNELQELKDELSGELFVAVDH